MRDVQIWKRELFDTIEEISCAERLKDLWLGRRPGEMSSYEECVCHIFNDYDIDGFLRLHKTLLSTEQSVALHLFRDQFSLFIKQANKSYGMQARPEDILNDASWEKVTLAAKQVCAADSL